MALPVITVNDFTGWLKIVANQFKQTDLEEYITLFQEQYLRVIVGAGAYQDIENQDRQKWTDLLNGANYVDTEGKRQYFEGLTKALIRFIYFEFVRDNFTSTQVGRVKGKSENSERANDLEVANVARSRYNQGIFITTDLYFFLEANEKLVEDITSFIDNLDGTYLLNLSSTKYLAVGDTITINDVEYTVTALTTDTDISIDAGQTGIDFTGSQASWKPYADVNYCEIEPAPI